MSIRDPRAVFRARLIEARWAILTLTLVVGLLALVFAGIMHRYGPDGDVFGSVTSDDPGVICTTYGIGGKVCAPAPDGVRRYREERAAERKARS